MAATVAVAPRTSVNIDRRALPDRNAPKSWTNPAMRRKQSNEEDSGFARHRRGRIASIASTMMTQPSQGEALILRAMSGGGHHGTPRRLSGKILGERGLPAIDNRWKYRSTEPNSRQTTSVVWAGFMFEPARRKLSPFAYHGAATAVD